MTGKAKADGEDLEQLKNYNIKIKLPADEWPVHHMNSFQKIITIGAMRFSTYPAADEESNDAFWKSEIKARAQRLVAVASRNVGNKSSEMKWRLDTEAILYDRFDWRVECPESECKGRVWRSEVEVVAEEKGPISNSIQERRKTRKACRCDAETRLRHHHTLGLNRMFDNRAGDLVIYGGKAQSELQSRMPDRVYGLAQTKRFDRALQRAAEAIAARAVAGSTIPANTNLVQTTPFKETMRPLIFPFLISEAKSERGDSFDASIRQSAFPIWKFLKLQEQLQLDTRNHLAEQGGPLVWFFTNRGEDWRLYGCYTDCNDCVREDESSGSVYNVTPLWSGRVDSLDGALQILLLVDYIFDWARDLYRPGILKLLKAMLKRCDLDSTSISADSEIYSLGHNSEIISPTERIISWQERMESMSTSIPCSESTDPPLPLLQQWKTTDTAERVFRHASAIENCFRCVLLTKDSIADVFGSLVDRGCSRSFLQNYARLLLDRVRFKISEDALSGLEKQWTGKTRTSEHNLLLTTPKYAFITYDILLSDSWQPIRTMACVIFDQSAIPALYSWAKYTRWKVTGQKEWQNSKDMSTSETQSLVECIRKISVWHNLGAAIERKSLYLTEISCSHELAGEDAMGKAKFGFLENKDFHPSDFIAKLCQLPSTKTIQPFIWSSNQIENQPPMPFLTGPEAVSQYDRTDVQACYPLYLRDYSELVHVLVFRRRFHPSDQGGPDCCIFSIGASTEAPSIHDQHAIIASIASQADNNEFPMTSVGQVNLMVNTSSLKNPVAKPRQALKKWSVLLQHDAQLRLLKHIVREQQNGWAKMLEIDNAVRTLLKEGKRELQSFRLSSPSKRTREDIDDKTSQDTDADDSQDAGDEVPQISSSKRVKVDHFSRLTQALKKSS